MRDIGHCEDQRLGRPYYLRLIGDVCKSRQCVKIEGARGACTMFQDLPGKLVLQGFFWKLRGVDPFGQFDGRLLEPWLVCTGLAQHGRHMRQLRYWCSAGLGAVPACRVVRGKGLGAASLGGLGCFRASVVGHLVVHCVILLDFAIRGQSCAPGGGARVLGGPIALGAWATTNLSPK